jgi:6-phosphofructokinase 1
VFVYEAMGRHCRWLAAAAAGRLQPADAPQLILFPSGPFDENVFIDEVKDTVAPSAGASWSPAKHRTAKEIRRGAGAGKDSFGHTQLGGVAAHLPAVSRTLGTKVH